ncbi:MAG: hypothetical protein HOC71_05240 [Candidatus Latescibacteria bacterium]|nr:hypothetical protein [Candidatus Latescibacterota bacterium]
MFRTSPGTPYITSDMAIWKRRGSIFPLFLFTPGLRLQATSTFTRRRVLTVSKQQVCSKLLKNGLHDTNKFVVFTK